MANMRCKEEYIARIHKVQDYIERNQTKSLTVEELSEVAGFSKFHFGRIFQGILGESLAHYVNRIRIENSMFLLAHRTDLNMTDIALETGFTDSAVFSRAFKNIVGMSPREYRKEYRTNCKETILISEYNGLTAKKTRVTNPSIHACITMEELDEMQIVYVRHTGSYETLAVEYGKLMERLYVEASKQNLYDEKTTWVFAIYHDNPEFGEKQQFRTSLCMSVPIGKEVKETGVLSTMKLEGGRYAVGHFRIRANQYPDIWNYMYREWLTSSGYVPRNSYPFEVYRNNPKEDPEHINEVDIYVPIEPM